MFVVYLREDCDQDKISQVRDTALLRGLIFCVPGPAPHVCIKYPTENAVLVFYHTTFQPILRNILSEIYKIFGPEPFGLEEDTSEDVAIPHSKTLSAV